jgi:asparagine synthase (glutamine-hydrolysing)
MCGITGIIGWNGVAADPAVLVRMTDEITHRGPDGEGFLITNAAEAAAQLQQQRPGAIVVSRQHRGQVAMGHRRLSIVDLSNTAGQPMTEVTGRYWIVFNGEIYNHATLREELKQKGYTFKTDHSDTEVILNAYACWGVDCLQKFNGMWAFCLWDTQENTFFLARDRAGKKPLYHALHQGQFYFASELKALLVNRNIPRQIDQKAVYDYLTYMMVPAPGTIFKDIYKLPAAHYLLFKAGEEIKPVRYWSPFSNAPELRLSEKEIMEGIRERIYEAARLRMLADVEVGVLLSGGLDSSINLACLSKYATKPIKAFSVGFANRNGYKNEFEYAEKVAKKFNAEYHELTLTEKDFLDFFPEMVYYQDEPIADTANIPIYYIAKTARKNNVKVLLGGEGSDELFVGYELWKLSRQFANLLEGKPGMASLAAGLHKNSPAKHKRLFYFNWYEKVRNRQPVFWSGTELRSEKQKLAMLSPEFRNSLSGYSSFEPMREFYELYHSKGDKEKYTWMTAADLQYRLPDLLLARLDRMLMAASVEGRNPFLDVNVIEYAMRIPAAMKTSGGQEKSILKKAFEGILPHDIIYRKKDSFTVPLDHLFNSKEFKGRARDAIASFNRSAHVFSEDYIKNLTGRAAGGELWNISNLALWYERFAG